MVCQQLIARLGLTLVICALTVTAADESVGDFTPPEGLPDGWFARIDTSEGRIIARLLPVQAPQSVAHFAALAEGRLEWFDETSGQLQKYPYYDGVKVHRVAAGRLFEAGRPGPGQIAPDLFVPQEGYGPVDFSHPGRLGMVREGGTNSGVKFFVTASGQPPLNGISPCFGIVVSGLDAVINISQTKAYGNGRPIDPPVIERIRIFSVGEVAPLPEPESFTHQRPDPAMRQDQTKPVATPEGEGSGS